MVFSFGPFSDAVGVEPDPPGTKNPRFWCGGTASTPSESPKSAKGKDHGLHLRLFAPFALFREAPLPFS